jgi:hypothetical protein
VVKRPGCGTDRLLPSSEDVKYALMYIYLWFAFGVFTTVTIQSTIFWGVVPCGLGISEGIYCLHLQGTREGEENSKACWRTLYPEDGGITFLRDVGKLLSDYVSSHPRRLYSLFVVYLTTLEVSLSIWHGVLE